MGFCAWFCQCCCGCNVGNNDNRTRDINNNISIHRRLSELVEPLINPMPQLTKEEQQQGLAASHPNRSKMTEEEQLQLAICLSQSEADKQALAAVTVPENVLPVGFDEEEALQLAIVLSEIEEEEQKKPKCWSEGDSDLCVICQSSKRSYLFADCKHIVCCRDCAKRFKVHTGEDGSFKCCPICRKPLSRLPIKVFF